MVGFDHLAFPHRQFLRQGCLNKFSTRKGYLQRMFFLVSAQQILNLELHLWIIICLYTNLWNFPCYVYSTQSVSYSNHLFEDYRIVELYSITI